MRTVLSLCVAILFAVTLDAHVTVAPRESTPGAGERYTVRVPTEGQVATTSVELEVPADVTITGILVGAGFNYEVKREGERIVAVTWRQEVKPAEVAEYVFFARNPKTGQQIAWKARQRFADGTSADWVGVEGDRRPASITRLVARQAPAGH